MPGIAPLRSGLGLGLGADGGGHWDRLGWDWDWDGMGWDWNWTLGWAHAAARWGWRRTAPDRDLMERVYLRWNLELAGEQAAGVRKPSYNAIFTVEAHEYWLASWGRQIGQFTLLFSSYTRAP